MNTRIREFAEQAGSTHKQNLGVYQFYSDELEKFAELIVKECISVVEGGRFLHDQAPTAIFARECSGAIKRHFGVEE